MKKLFSLIALLSLAVGFTACEEKTPDTPDAPTTTTVSLSADKSAIVADGVETVSFEATVNGVVTSDAVQIICLNDNSVLSAYTFKTTAAGEYRFVAVCNGVKSNEVKVLATNPAGPTVVLTADKSTIVADNADAVTFTVTVDGEDKTAESTITIVNYASTLDGNTFVSDVAGEFVFEATFDGEKSNQVIVTATAVEAPVQKSLTIEASKLRIKADGEDCATLTVMYGEEDVTATCEIRTTAGDVIEGGSFATTTPGSYNIYALYDNVRSNTISVDAYDPNIASAYEIGQIYDINGAKGVAYAIKTDNQNRTWAYFFSMDEADLQWSTENVWCNCVASRGDWNTEDMLRNGTSPDMYPAAQWCIAHGDGWFMPSSQELQWMWDAISEGTHNFDNASVAAYNKLLTDNGGMPFVETYYWSSNETADDLVELIAFMNDSVVCLDPQKTYTYTVRAATRVQLN
ncbi:MAG: hypothetical protein IIX58_03835 [Alistipes sp.]|nr:hypothetical protein [Alistipes sp.]